MKILVLGANGMLGNACINYFGQSPLFQVTGTVRSESACDIFSRQNRALILPGVNIANEEIQKRLFEEVRPDVVINCVGVVKQVSAENSSLSSIILNSVLPHQLSLRCDEYGVRLIQVSTDCVFSGLKGVPYVELDESDACDLYGRTKYLGEISDRSNVLTLRTSYIGNELNTAHGLLEWFLAQGEECQGYTRAIYSGLPSIIFVKVLESVLLKHGGLSGLYHVSSSPISKYNLLNLIAKVFDKKIRIVPNDALVIDRSLDSSRFTRATGFIAPPWEQMVEKMYIDRMVNVQR